MLRLKNTKKKHGGLGFPAVEGGEAFELDAGKERELSESHWDKLKDNEGVKGFLAEGSLEVEPVSAEPALEAPPVEPPGMSEPVLVGVDEDKLPPTAEALGVESESDKPKRRGR
jgi:hypothetical protein